MQQCNDALDQDTVPAFPLMTSRGTKRKSRVVTRLTRIAGENAWKSIDDSDFHSDCLVTFVAGPSIISTIPII